ncbi:MAG: CotH kinase family protein, partial [Opitutales bacterium]|nr:CotH kinase family protein [Opitutales bacterium]
MKYHPLTFALRLPVLFGLLLAYSLQPTAYSLTPTVRINEVMASNGTTIADEDGDFEDWIELYNYGTDPVDLSGWGLSDSYNNPFKWTFPGGTSIGAGEYLLVWASGKNRVIAYDRSWFQPFIDEAQGAWLFQGDQTPPHVLDRSVSENHGTINGEVTFVAENGFEQVLHFLPTGFVTLDHPFETAGDFTVSYWVKSLRATDWRAVNLSNGFGIGHWRSNRIVLMNPYVVVDLSTHLEVGSWEHVVFRRSENRVAVFLNGKAVGEGDWNGVLRLDRIGGKSGASGWAGMEGSLADVLFFDYALSAEALSDIFEGRRAAFGHWHTNYALSASGEEVLLTMPDGTLVDELAPTALPRDISIGRVEGEGDAWFFFDEPTPGGTNVTTAYLGILDPPTFSHVGGFYEEGFDLVLSHPEPEVAIVYSLDGSEPAIDNLLGTTFLYKNEYPEKPTDPFGPFLTSSYISHLYTEPLTIQDRSGEPDLLTQISSTTDAFPHYAPETPVRKGFSVQARAYKEGWLSSRSAANSYFVFEEGNPYTLPVISKQIQKDDLFDYYTGIYTAGLRMDEWRLANPEADVAWWFKNGNFRGRGDEWERTAFVEVFEDGVPHALLNQRVGVRIHGNTSRNLRAKSLRLYARGEYDNASVMDYRFLGDQYLHGLVSASESFKRILLRRRGAQRDYIQDPFAHRLMQPVYEGILRSRPAISFINGEYWGITNIRDRFDRHHLALNYGLDTDDLVVTFRDRIEDGGVIGAALFSELVEFILENEMKEDSIFEVVRQSLCLDSFSNFIIMNSYLQSPHFEHGFWRVKTPVDKSFGDGRWRIYTQDFDQIMRSSAGFNWMVDRKLRPSEEIYEALFQNAGFRRQFVNRFLDHINSTFTPHRIEEIVRGVYDEISPYVHEDEHRWSQNIAPFSSVNQIINFGRSRPASQREELRGRFSLGMDVEITLAASMESGKIRLNTLVIDSDLLGVQGYPYPWTGTYFQGVPIELEALPEPGHRFVGWVVSPTNGLASLSEGEPDFYSTEPLISLDLSGDTTVEAVFEPIPLADLPV